MELIFINTHHLFQLWKVLSNLFLRLFVYYHNFSVLNRLRLL